MKVKHVLLSPRAGDNRDRAKQEHGDGEAGKAPASG